MLRIILVRPGSTQFDEQGRIKGSLSIPLSTVGRGQVDKAVGELSAEDIEAVYCSPCESARQTADLLAGERRVKPKVIEKLSNLDHGLWHGKLIADVRRQQPRVYKSCREHPEEVCPPEGESMCEARSRVGKALSRILRRHKEGTLALVVPEPMASVVRCILLQSDLPDLWKAECDTGSWELIEVISDTALVGAR
ncbi:MAG: histidine phosphatase family protein [Pirellulaceae bacterium]|jgi:broad specificity phosphatase PhoE|nr:histidine phosphatase family protein [Planctomycetaceae bacterium]